MIGLRFLERAKRRFSGETRRLVCESTLLIDALRFLGLAWVEEKEGRAGSRATGKKWDGAKGEGRREKGGEPILIFFFLCR